jgi:hypothetical protein
MRLVPGRAATEDHNAGHRSSNFIKWPDDGSPKMPSPTIAGVFIDDDMHGGFLGRGCAAVNADVVRTLIRTWIRRVEGEGDEPTCAHVADLIVDELTIAVGAVTDSVAIPLIGHIGHLTGQPARQTFMGPRFPIGETPCPQFTRAFRGRVAFVEVDASLF